MRVEVRMPRLGYDMETGRIAAWTKAVGQAVGRGDVIAEIETDKATVEMESVTAGRLVEIVAGAGEELPVDAIIAWIEDEA